MVRCWLFSKDVRRCVHLRRLLSWWRRIAWRLRRDPSCAGWLNLPQVRDLRQMFLVWLREKETCHSTFRNKLICERLKQDLVFTGSIPSFRFRFRSRSHYWTLFVGARGSVCGTLSGLSEQNHIQTVLQETFKCFVHCPRQRRQRQRSYCDNGQRIPPVVFLTDLQQFLLASTKEHLLFATNTPKKDEFNESEFIFFGSALLVTLNSVAVNLHFDSQFQN